MSVWPLVNKLRILQGSIYNLFDFIELDCACIFFFFSRIVAAQQKSVTVPVRVWHRKGFVMQSPVGMNCCSPKQEALCFSLGGDNMSRCLCWVFAWDRSSEEPGACVAPAEGRAGTDCWQSYLATHSSLEMHTSSCPHRTALFESQHPTLVVSAHPSCPLLLWMQLIAASVIIN